MYLLLLLLLLPNTPIPLLSPLLLLQRWDVTSGLEEDRLRAEEVRATLERRAAQLTLSAMQHAARGDMKELKGLREGGADFMLADYDGRTVLHLAAARGYTEVCAFVLREGADVNRKGERRTGKLGLGHNS